MAVQDPAGNNLPAGEVPAGSQGPNSVPVGEEPGNAVALFNTLDTLSGVVDLSATLGDSWTTLFKRAIEAGGPGADDPNNQIGVQRTPFAFTCQRWLEDEQGSRVLLWRCNPSQVSWSMPLRAADEKAHIGTVQHVWRDNPRGTFYDEPVLTFQFQSGNIIPQRTRPFIKADRLRGNTPAQGPASLVGSPRGDFQAAGGGENVATNLGPPPQVEPQGNPGTRPVTNIRVDESEQLTEATMPLGMVNFYQFLELVDEQRILDDGRTNLVYVIYNSNIFPAITMTGLFTPAGHSWTDDAQNPNQINGWSAQFTVYDSYPKANRPLDLMRVFTSAGYRRVG